MDTTTQTLSDYDMEGAQINWRSAHKDGWAMMDMTLPNVTAKIATDKHETTLMKRIIALHGVNGTCSNTTIFGAIDFFCLNGQITGDHSKVCVRTPATSASTGSSLNCTSHNRTSLHRQNRCSVGLTLALLM